MNYGSSYQRQTYQSQANQKATDQENQAYEENQYPYQTNQKDPGEEKTSSYTPWLVGGTQVAAAAWSAYLAYLVYLRYQDQIDRNGQIPFWEDAGAPFPDDSDGSSWPDMDLSLASGYTPWGGVGPVAPVPPYGLDQFWWPITDGQTVGTVGTTSAGGQIHSLGYL